MSAPGTLDLAGIRARAEAASKGTSSVPVDLHPMFVLAFVDEVERLTERLAGMEIILATERRADHMTAGQWLIVANSETRRADAAEAEAAKLRARVAELEGK